VLIVRKIACCFLLRLLIGAFTFFFFSQKDTSRSALPPAYPPPSRSASRFSAPLRRPSGVAACPARRARRVSQRPRSAMHIACTNARGRTLATLATT
jgi:hypothetical protein